MCSAPLCPWSPSGLGDRRLELTLNKHSQSCQTESQGRLARGRGGDYTCNCVIVLWDSLNLSSEGEGPVQLYPCLWGGSAPFPGMSSSPPAHLSPCVQPETNLVSLPGASPAAGYSTFFCSSCLSSCCQQDSFPVLPPARTCGHNQDCVLSGLSWRALQPSVLLSRHLAQPSTGRPQPRIPSLCGKVNCKKVTDFSTGLLLRVLIRVLLALVSKSQNQTKPGYKWQDIDLQEIDLLLVEIFGCAHYMWMKNDLPIYR